MSWRITPGAAIIANRLDAHTGDGSRTEDGFYLSNVNTLQSAKGLRTELLPRI